MIGHKWKPPRKGEDASGASTLVRREARARIAAEILAVLLVAYIWLTDPKAGGASGLAILAGGAITAWALHHARRAAGPSIPHPGWAVLWIGLYIASFFVYPLVGTLAVVGAYAASRRPKSIAFDLFSRKTRRITWAALAGVTLAALYLVGAEGSPAITPALATLTFFTSGTALLFSLIAAHVGTPERRRARAVRAALLGGLLGIGFALPLVMNVQSAALASLLSPMPLAREEIIVLVALPLILTGLSLRTWIQKLWPHRRGRRAIIEFALLSLLGLLGIASALDASADPNATEGFASEVAALRYVGFILGMAALGLRTIMKRDEPLTCRPPRSPSRTIGDHGMAIRSATPIPKCAPAARSPHYTSEARSSSRNLERGHRLASEGTN